ncbi:MAG: hypothetical protein DRJ43_00870 [Thermoprotei archaeon]|nr:MAG: hypothetical protein DRJ43_00870 [Thermoprotei archaeon]
MRDLREAATWGGAWPLPPRPGQDEIARKLVELLSSGARVLLTAPTGWGKTLAVLVALHSSKLLPAVWMVRSLTLGRRVGEDAALLRLLTVTVAGREKTCPMHEELGEGVHDYCRYFRYECPYSRLPMEVRASSYEELVELGVREGFCPYYAQDVMVERADVIVQSYYRRLPRLARSFVVDEAHNLLMPREASYRISEFVEAVDEVRRIGGSDRLVRSLGSIIRYAISHDGPLDVKLFLDEEALTELHDLYLEALRSKKRGLTPVIRVVKAQAAYIDAEFLLVYEPRRILPYRPAVFMTATMPRGAEKALHVEAILEVPWRKKLRAELVSHLTTKYGEFDSNMVLGYKKLLLELEARYSRVVAFAASSRVSRELLRVSDYYEVQLPPDWKGVALFRARGKFSEGVDLPADVVVMLGCPYLPPEVSNRLARCYRAMGVGEPIKMAVDVPMLVTTLQCIGRVVRSPDANPVVVLADDRYSKYRKELEGYLELE